MIAQKGKRASARQLDPSSDELSSAPSLDHAVTARIGGQLRAMYDELMQQPMPDKLKHLLAQLEEPDGKSEG